MKIARVVVEIMYDGLDVLVGEGLQTIPSKIQVTDGRHATEETGCQ